MVAVIGVSCLCDTLHPGRWFHSTALMPKIVSIEDTNHRHEYVEDIAMGSHAPIITRPDQASQCARIGMIAIYAAVPPGEFPNSLISLSVPAAGTSAILSKGSSRSRWSE